jgi:hypothetical protein
MVVVLLGQRRPGASVRQEGRTWAAVVHPIVPTEGLIAIVTKRAEALRSTLGGPPARLNEWLL